MEEIGLVFFLKHCTRELTLKLVLVGLRWQITIWNLQGFLSLNLVNVSHYASSEVIGNGIVVCGGRQQAGNPSIFALSALLLLQGKVLNFCIGISRSLVDGISRNLGLNNFWPAGLKIRIYVSCLMFSPQRFILNNFGEDDDNIRRYRYHDHDVF